MTILDPSSSLSAKFGARATRVSPRSGDTHSSTSDMIVLLIAGVVCGLALHWLVWDRLPGGLGLVVWSVLASATVCWLNRHQAKPWRIELAVWSLVMVAASGLAALRASPAVILPMFLVMLLSLGLVYYKTHVEALADARLPMLIKAAWRFPARIALGIMPPIDALLRQSHHNNPRVRGVLRGALFATPLLVVFVMLFASADALVDQQLNRLTTMLGQVTPVTPLISLLLVALTTGVLSCTLVQSHNKARGTATGSAPDTANSWLRLGAEETAVIMGSIALLFIAFVALQAFYLFGGYDVIAERADLTVASYARRGFFELLLVAGLTLALLMTMASTDCHQTLFRRFGAVLISCVMVMLVSAVMRLTLYIDHFGMTLSRMMALAVLGWLGGSLLWFAATVLRGNPRHFLSALLYGAITIMLLFAAANPAARVAQINLQLARTGQVPLDITYLTHLGADALPVYANFLQTTDTRNLTTCALNRMWAEFAEPVTTDWRDWNLARHHAQRIVAETRTMC
ncbi:DUF4173 domain-containing protein [Pseudohongiella sp. SYSU M77423]|uniref:DUF4153 domain-containing protein n=1 Tax=Pseudohongiella sp. SYSU M77423 TaxID=3042312 RepID=UPI00247FDF14|nr:DUF4173 domain-containing protein [Pseudohongiella sp. SYSU M77423]MDH7943353.1 DUF4173 domain-containing protein [Pseudohongiella sp. SYSU M77423]